jgi:eukaryotic-like serine/threonine-protein kinase
MKDGKQLYEFGPFRVDPERHLLLRNDQPVPLTPKAFETLLVLVRHSREVVSKDDLMKTLWPDTFVEETNLSRNIFMLRKALGETPEDHRYIVTLPGRGYRFADEVRTVTTLPTDLVVESHSRSKVVIAQSQSFRWTWILAGILVLAVAGGILFWSLAGRQRRAGVSAGLIPTRRSIAILGFQNVSGDPRDAWLSTAFSEMLATELAVGGQLRMLSSEDIAQTKINLSLPITDTLSKATLGRVRQNLGADLVVLGSYSALENGKEHQIRLDLRLQDAAAGETLTSISETGTETDLYELVSRAGASLRQTLAVQPLLPVQVVNVRASLPGDPQAARFYAEGLERLRIFDAVGARDLLLKSIALEPKFALSHSALSEAYIALGYETKAKEAASRAFQSSGDLSHEERLLVEGQYRMASHEWDKAIDSYRMLFDLFPDNLDYGLRLAAAQTFASKSRDALATLEVLRRLPAPPGTDPRIDIAESVAWDRLSEYKQQEQALEKAITKARSQGARLVLARARGRQCWVFGNIGEGQKAIDACREAEQIYAATGDTRGEEDTLRSWGDAVADSNPAAGIQLYQQALDLAKRIGSVAGQASALNEMAIQYGVMGDHAKAKNLYLQSLADFREIDDKAHTAPLMGNVANELMFQGRLADSMKMYKETVNRAHELGATSAEGDAAYNIGVLLQFQGDLAAAKEWFSRSLTLFQTADNRVAATYPLYGLGELAMMQADFAGANKLLQQSLAARQAEQEKVASAESSLDLALLDLNEGRSLSEAEEMSRGAAQVLHDARVKDEEARAYSILASVLLGEGKTSEALPVAERANVIASKSQDPNYRLSIAVVSSRVRGLAASVNDSSVPQILAALSKTSVEAGKLGYVGIQLQARLALGEIEMKSGKRILGRNHLEAVEKDAAAKGFFLIAHQASTART